MAMSDHTFLPFRAPSLSPLYRHTHWFASFACTCTELQCLHEPTFHVYFFIFFYSHLTCSYSLCRTLTTSLFFDKHSSTSLFSFFKREPTCASSLCVDQPTSFSSLCASQFMCTSSLCVDNTKLQCLSSLFPFSYWF